MKAPNSITRRLISGGQWAIVNKILTALSALTLNALLTRLLPPEEVGAYYIISSIVAIGMLFALMGTQQGVVRLLSAALASDNAQLPRRAIKSCFVIAAISTLILCTAYYSAIGEYMGGVIFKSELVTGAILMTAIWIAARAIQTFQAQIFRGFNRVDLATTFEGTVTGVLLACALTIVWLFNISIDIYDVLLVTLIALATAISIGLTFVSKLYASTSQSQHTSMSKAVHICIPLFIASIALQGVNEMHIWILGNAADGQEVALYGTAFLLAKFVIIPLVIINSVIPPTIAQLHYKNMHVELENILRASATIACIPSLAIVIIFSIGAEFILKNIYGEFYVDGANILILMLTAQLINSLTGSPGVLLSMSNKQQIVMYSAVLSGMLGLALSLILTPSLGATGASIGLAAGLITNNIVMWLYCLFNLKISTHMRFLTKAEICRAYRVALNKDSLKAG